MMFSDRPMGPDSGAEGSGSAARAQSGRPLGREDPTRRGVCREGELCRSNPWRTRWDGRRLRTRRCPEICPVEVAKGRGRGSEPLGARDFRRIEVLKLLQGVTGSPSVASTSGVGLSENRYWFVPPAAARPPRGRLACSFPTQVRMSLSPLGWAATPQEMGVDVPKSLNTCLRTCVFRVLYHLNEGRGRGMSKRWEKTSSGDPLSLLQVRF